MAQLFRAALLEDLSSSPGIYPRWLTTTYNSSSRDPKPLASPHIQPPQHTQPHTRSSGKMGEELNETFPQKRETIDMRRPWSSASVSTREKQSRMTGRSTFAAPGMATIKSQASTSVGAVQGSGRSVNHFGKQWSRSKVKQRAAL